ncbi:MAG: 2'-5' RNA ligase family protein [Enhydrobacter sp.]|nr:MAG: 2'-5' RNA ligase family protein [Enhydrobacter sp.]
MRDMVTGSGDTTPSLAFTPSHRSPPPLTTARLRRFHGGMSRPRSVPTDRLFFAVLPDPDTAARIAELARRLRTRHGLTGAPILPEHLHVTLLHVGDGIGLPPGLVATAIERTEAVAMPRFRAEFDRVMSFKGGPLVLAGDDSVIGLEILHQRLSDAFDARPRQARRFKPHLTLLRDRQRLAETAIEPIGWTASELVLVHSMLGLATHRHLARFPLH